MPRTMLEPAAFPLAPNLVWRSYSGGSVLREFRGLPAGQDDHFPEDWLASTVEARNGVHSQSQGEGVSRLLVGDEAQLFTELLAAEPEFWFGPATAPSGTRQGTGVLWKLLDSAVRLQFQAHPSAAFARERLGSNAGKTECWYILGTRGTGHVYLGFQRPPGREKWKRLIQSQNTEGMKACFEPIRVTAGDCFAVPAGVPHAIGANVFMMELQEPTDWVVRCERVTAGLELPPEARFMGRDLETCLDVFDYSQYSLNDVNTKFKQTPRQLRAEGFLEEEIISQKFHSFFRLHRFLGNGAAAWNGNELMLLIVTQGSGEVVTDAQHVTRAKRGDVLLLPGAAGAWTWQPRNQRWEFLLAKLPISNAAL